MDDELPDWDHDEPEGLHALRALVGELAQTCLTNYDGVADTYRAFCDDRDADHSWRLAFLELMVMYVRARLSSEGQRLALARQRHDIEIAREQAAKEMSE